MNWNDIINRRLLSGYGPSIAVILIVFAAVVAGVWWLV